MKGTCSCVWFQNFSNSWILSQIPVTLYHELHVHCQVVEQSFGILVEYSNSSEYMYMYVRKDIDI